MMGEAAAPGRMAPASRFLVKDVGDQLTDETATRAAMGAAFVKGTSTASHLECVNESVVKYRT